MTKFQYYIKIYLYYDPEICRFITIDDISYLNPDVINGVNLYAYCGNNPIMNVDPSGCAFLTAFLISMGIAALIGGTFAGIDAFTGKLSKTILESYALDGVHFMLKNKILVGIISILKNASKNKDKWFEFIFN